MSLYRADADGDAPCANTEDNAVCVRSGVEGEPADGARQAGLSVPPFGKPPRASHTLPVLSQRAAARKPCFAQREELHYQQSGRHSDRTGREEIHSTSNKNTHEYKRPALISGICHLIELHMNNVMHKLYVNSIIHVPQCSIGQHTNTDYKNRTER